MSARQALIVECAAGGRARAIGIVADALAFDGVPASREAREQQ